MAAGTSALLLAIGGGVAGIAALTRDDSKPRIVTAIGDSASSTGVAPAQPVPPAATAPLGAGQAGWDHAAPGHAAAGLAGGSKAGTGQAGSGPITAGRIGADAVGSRTSSEADRTAPRKPVRVPGKSPAAPATSPAQAGRPAVKQPPAVTTRTDTETREIPFSTRVVRDPSIPRGTRQVQTAGVAGEQTLRYLVTLTGGRPTSRRLLDSTVTRQPQPQVVAIGDQASGQNAGDDPIEGPGPDGGGAWPGGWRHRHCGHSLNFCFPLGRGESCPDDVDYGDPEVQRLEDASAAPVSGDVGVSGNDLDVLGGKTGNDLGVLGGKTC